MTTMNVELYRVLKQLGAADDAAEAAASSLPEAAQIATKADIALLRTELHEALSTQTKWIAGIVVTALVALTGIYAGLVVLILRLLQVRVP